MHLDGNKSQIDEKMLQCSFMMKPLDSIQANERIVFIKVHQMMAVSAGDKLSFRLHRYASCDLAIKWCSAAFSDMLHRFSMNPLTGCITVCRLPIMSTVDS